MVYENAGKEDFTKGLLGVTTHFSVILKIQFGKNAIHFYVF